MSFFKFLVGSPEAAVKTAGVIAKGIDELHYSKEEQAQGAQKAQEWLVEYMKATTGQNVARRMIAVIVTGEWALFVNIWAVLRLSGRVAMAKDFLTMLQDVIAPAFAIVMAFYFTAGMVQRGLETWKNNKEKG